MNLNKKERIIEIDYIKSLLILLVIFGHFLECFETKLSINIYKFIYIFHIPLFVFVSGYLAKFKIKDIIKLFIIYFIFQILYLMFVNFGLNQDLKNTLFTIPYWILWYLFALIIWKLTIPLLNIVNKNIFSKIIFLLLIIGLSLLIGYVDCVNRTFSLARIINFYPFFAIGYFISNRKNNNKNFKFLYLGLFILSISLSIILTNFNYFSNESLYRAIGYNSSLNSIMQRILLIVFPFMVLPLIFSTKIRKNFKIIEIISKNTLTIYLLHGFIILLFKHFNILINNTNVLISLLISVLVVIILAFIGHFIKMIKNKLLKF